MSRNIKLILRIALFFLSLDLFSQVAISMHPNQFQNALKGIFVVDSPNSKEYTLLVSCITENKEFKTGILLNRLSQEKFANKIIQINEKYKAWLMEVDSNQSVESSNTFNEKFQLSGYSIKEEQLVIYKFKEEIEITFERFQIDGVSNSLFIIKFIHNNEIEAQTTQNLPPISLVFSNSDEVEKFASVFRKQ